MRVQRKSVTQRAWKMAICFAVYAIMTLIGANELEAQRPSSTTVSFPDGNEPPDFSGTWRVIRGPRGRGFVEAEACGEIKDISGAPMIRCSQPWNKLKDYLNKRALAWMEFRDEAMSTKHLCLTPTLPALADFWAGTVFRMGPGELRILYMADSMGEGLHRSVWMDGRKHPSAHEVFYHGHSIGWYEGDELVIETTNFTFDPDGLEDHLHIPSSSMKKLTERWKKTGPNELSITYTQEDPMFLKKPWTWTWVHEKSEMPPLQNFHCDPTNAWDEVIVTGASKYED